MRFYKLYLFRSFVERFIKKSYLTTVIQVKEYVRTRKLIRKIFMDIPKYVLEVLITGWLIHYAITQFNFVSVGIAVALVTYYIQWLISTYYRIKKE